MFHIRLVLLQLRWQGQVRPEEGGPGLEDQEAGGGQRGGAVWGRDLCGDDPRRSRRSKLIKQQLHRSRCRRFFLFPPPRFALLLRAHVLGLGAEGPVPEGVGEVQLQSGQVGSEAVRFRRLFGSGLIGFEFYFLIFLRSFCFYFCFFFFFFAVEREKKDCVSRLFDDDYDSV